MSEKKAKNVLSSLRHRMVFPQGKNRDVAGIKRINRFISNIQGAGLIDGIELNGKKGRFLFIKGVSWQNACRVLKEAAAPSFVVWEEAEFFSFLESQFHLLDKPPMEHTP